MIQSLRAIGLGQKGLVSNRWFPLHYCSLQDIFLSSFFPGEKKLILDVTT